ncbi:cysteine synthase family protein [Candidatus Dojkabacteria bacterium]|nr:cysteine synthase family protein [Candidatus Dojkabacteria bacterium]
MIKKNILELIGKTPIIQIKKLNPHEEVEILAKLEGLNPSGSIKDRVALNMIEEAEKSRELTKDKVILEASSGNTGIAIAMAGAYKDYKVTVIMPRSVSKERRQILKAYGAEVILTDSKDGTDGAIKKVEEMLQKNPAKYYNPNQYSNPNNPFVHFKTTAHEIIRDTRGKLDYIVVSLGSSGTLMGISRFFKKNYPSVRIVSAEARVGHRIQGLKNMEESLVPEIFDTEDIDERVEVKDEDAFRVTKKLARKEGILAGLSSGAAMWVALQLAKRIRRGRILVILPDRGERYLSTGVFD